MCPAPNRMLSISQFHLPFYPDISHALTRNAAEEMTEGKKKLLEFSAERRTLGFNTNTSRRLYFYVLPWISCWSYLWKKINVPWNCPSHTMKNQQQRICTLKATVAQTILDVHFLRPVHRYKHPTGNNGFWQFLTRLFSRPCSHRVSSVHI